MIEPPGNALQIARKSVLAQAAWDYATKVPRDHLL